MSIYIVTHGLKVREPLYHSTGFEISNVSWKQIWSWFMAYISHVNKTGQKVLVDKVNLPARGTVPKSDFEGCGAVLYM